MKYFKVDIPSYLREWAGKKDILEMCIELNVSESTLSYHAKELKISLKLDSKVKRMNLVKDLVRNNQHLTIAEITKMAEEELGEPLDSMFVRNVSKRLGIDLRMLKNYHRPKPKIEESEFFREWEYEDWIAGGPRGDAEFKRKEKITLSQSHRLSGSTPDRTRSRPNGRGLYLKKST